MNFMRTRQKQRIIIGTLCAVIIGLAVGYAVLSSQLNIQGTSGITSDFKVVFTNIEEINQVPESGNYNDFDNGILAGSELGITHDITTLKAQVVNEHQIDLSVDMKAPGSMGVYEISVENTGKLDGYITDITGLDEANAEDPTDIQFMLLKFKENQKIRVGEVKKFVLIVSWSEEATTIPDTSKNLTLDLTVTQYSEQQQDRPDIPEPSGKTEYAIGDEVYFDPVKGQRSYSDEAWTLDDKGSTCYKWNVIKTSDSSSDTVELVLDHNLPGTTAWISLEDYQAAGGNAEEYGSDGNNKHGPITALKHLKQGTDNWNGVVTLTSADNETRENCSGENYTINYERYKARLISYQELVDILTEEGTGKLPTWTYSNMAVSVDEEGNPTFNDVYEHVVYWTNSALSFDPYYAWGVHYDGRVSHNSVSRADGYGVRPVVKILKSNL